MEEFFGTYNIKFGAAIFKNDLDTTPTIFPTQKQRITFGPPQYNEEITRIINAWEDRYEKPFFKDSKSYDL